MSCLLLCMPVLLTCKAWPGECRSSVKKVNLQEPLGFTAAFHGPQGPGLLAIARTADAGVSFPCCCSYLLLLLAAVAAAAAAICCCWSIMKLTIAAAAAAAAAASVAPGADAADAVHSVLVLWLLLWLLLPLMPALVADPCLLATSPP